MKTNKNHGMGYKALSYAFDQKDSNIPNSDSTIMYKQDFRGSHYLLEVDIKKVEKLLGPSSSAEDFATLVVSAITKIATWEVKEKV